MLEQALELAAMLETQAETDFSDAEIQTMLEQALELAALL